MGHISKQTVVYFSLARLPPIGVLLVANLAMIEKERGVFFHSEEETVDSILERIPFLDIVTIYAYNMFVMFSLLFIGLRFTVSFLELFVKFSLLLLSLRFTVLFLEPVDDRRNE